MSPCHARSTGSKTLWPVVDVFSSSSITFLFDLKKLGISPEAVDEFERITPRCSTQLKPLFFKDSFANHPRKHMFSATTELEMFTAVVVDPMRALHDHSELLRLARHLLAH